MVVRGELPSDARAGSSKTELLHLGVGGGMGGGRKEGTDGGVDGCCTVQLFVQIFDLKQTTLLVRNKRFCIINKHHKAGSCS